MTGKKICRQFVNTDNNKLKIFSGMIFNTLTGKCYARVQRSGKMHERN